ncbi:MAG: hypothetical protein WCK34_03760, partial [Bacteroidota bacterium]
MKQLYTTFSTQNSTFLKVIFLTIAVMIAGTMFAMPTITNVRLTTTYTTIQAAFDDLAALNGDVIDVSPGSLAGASFGSQTVTVTGVTSFSPFAAYGDPVTPVYVDDAIGDDTNTGENPTNAVPGTGPKKTINGGLSTVADPGVIYVAAGTYTENVVVNKDVTIHGAGTSTIVNGTSSASVFDIAVSGVTLENMRIDNGGTAADAILVDAGVSGVLIQDNTITNDVSNGIRFSSNPGSGNTVLHNIFTGSSAGSAVANDGTTSVTATHNNWASNKGPTISGNPCGNGKVVTTHVVYNPWSKITDINTDIYRLEDLAVTGTATICAGGTTTVTLTSPQAGTNFEYRLYRDDILVPSSMQTGSGSALTWSVTEGSAGSFTYTVKAVNTDNSCELVMTTSAVITVNATPTVSITGHTDILCYGNSTGALTITANDGTPGYQYLWSNSQTTFTITGLTAGSYSVTVTDANTCTVTTSTTITVPSAALSVSITGHTDILCNGSSTGKATVTATDGTPVYNYLWSNGLTSAAATGLTSGTYDVTVTDSHSCTATTSVYITQTTAMAEDPLKTEISCNNADDGIIDPQITGGTPLPGGPPDYIYLWNDGQVDPTHEGCHPGSYSVTVTDANSCSHVFGPYTFTEPTTFKFDNIITPVSCYGGSDGKIENVNITGGTTPYSYLWNTGSTTQDITGLTADSYSVVGTDARGCLVSGGGAVTQPTLLGISISLQTDVLCHGNSTGAATAAGNGGTTTYSYLWDNGQATATATGLTAGNYYVTVTDSHSCTASGMASITEPAVALTVTIPGTTNVLCHGNSTGSVSALAHNGSPGYTYLWSNGQNTALATGLTSGTYVVTVTDLHSCQSTTSAVITQPGV